ncbi:MAG: hypothetical protein QM661_11775 [Solimonas sp.]
MSKLIVRRIATLLLVAAIGAFGAESLFAQAALPAGAPSAGGEAAATTAPLPLGRLGAAPWTLHPLWFVGAALLVPLALWIALAWKRALDTDPRRWRRRGVRDLRRVLQDLRHAASAVPDAKQLYRWRDAAARAWNLRLATPTAADVEQAVAALDGDAALAAQWSVLWRDSEHGLFAADGRAPVDWLQRAVAVGDALAMPPREHRLPDRRAYWLPALGLPALAFVPLLLLMTGVAPAHADVPPSAAQSDADPAAATAARLEAAHAPSLAALAATPMDWAAHENVARYDIHLQDWDAAVAHGLAAFLLHASPATRDSLRYAYAQSAMADPALKRLLDGAWYERLPTVLSPRGWQQLALFAGVLLGAGLSAMVCGLYRSRARRLQRLALWFGGGGVAIVGLLLAATAVACWSAYGDLRMPGAGITLRAANLSPTPTQLVPQDETRPIAAGRVVVHQHTFLGWEQVAADRDLSGWLRNNAVLPLYGDAWILRVDHPAPAQAGH